MKYALIIGNNKYDDPKLAQLKTPAADSQALARVLDDKAIGGFDEVTPLINQMETTVRRAVSAFLTNKKPDDLVLLYFSGHGILDDRGRLYLALKDTQVNLLKATSIPSSFVADEMDSCRSKRQILILDCCHSGAFERGTKGEQKAITETTFEGSGFGRVVLTASDSTQYALEGDQVIKQTELSLFTHFLLEGLKTGEADTNNDGHISLDEWYDYTYGKVISETPKQVPHKWSYNQRGDLIIAKNPFVKKKIVELPYELMQALDSPFVGIRESAVIELGKYLKSPDPAMGELVFMALERMKNDDSRRISSLAEKLLVEYEQAHRPLVEAAPSSSPVKAETEPVNASLETPGMTADIQSVAVIQTSKPEVEKSNPPMAAAVTAERPVFNPMFWLSWIGATFLGAIILNLLKDFLYDNNEIIKSVPILFGLLAGLAGVMQGLVFRDVSRNWWAINLAVGAALGVLHFFLSIFEIWVVDQLFFVWVIGNFLLGPIWMWQARTRSKDISSAPSGAKAMSQFLETGARGNIFFKLLSVSLILAVVLNIHFLFDLYDWRDTSLRVYGIGVILAGLSIILNKAIPRNFGFITLTIFLLLEGISAAGLAFFIPDYALYYFAVSGFLGLISGLFFITQREIWKHAGFRLFAIYLITTGAAAISWDAEALSKVFLASSTLCAIPTAIYFFVRK